MPRFETTRKELDDLKQRHASHVAAAEDAQSKGDFTTAKAEIAKAQALNAEIADKQAFVDEADRYADAHAATYGTGRQDMSEMGRALAAGERVRIDVVDVFASMRRNAGTLYSGSIVSPQGGGSEIHEGFAGYVSSLFDQVNQTPMIGLSSWEESYEISDMQANSGKPSELAGTARPASDPVLAKAKMAAHETNVTAFVDRNISHLSPADYAGRVQDMAMRALIRKANSLIINGDGQASPDMFGILNAKNTDGGNIFASLTDVTSIDENTLNSLVFGYGGDETVGGNARLLLTKKNLQAFGALRGANEKQRLYKITRDPSNPNIGTIEDGGLIVPYTLTAAIGDKKLAYGDPMHYMLPIFGDFVIRVDESVKAVERMLTILGDGLISGNLTVDKGFSVATLA